MRSLIVESPPVQDHERVIILDSADAFLWLNPRAVYRADWICVKNGPVLKDRLSDA